MAKYHENSSKFLSVSSSENGDSLFSDAEAFEGDEEFYEEIEAPKFVDFTMPDHFHPDDRYWFCHRVGCDLKHEEEMDSEAIYKKFVLRVMAARSPNVRLRKILDRNASRKCPFSAPPKPSKPRLTKMALISSFSKKTAADDDKEKVVRPVSKPRSTPVAKSKPVAAKYLTTPRNKKCTSDENAFRSVRNPKPINTEVPKNRVVAKALVFRSPKKKPVKVKTSVELRTPVSKLCQGMNKLEITSKPPKSLSKSCSSRELNRKVQRRPEETLSKSGKSIKSKINGKLSQQKALMKEEKQKIKQEEFELEKPTHEEKCLVQEMSDNSRSQATTNGQENDNNSKINGKSSQQKVLMKEEKQKSKQEEFELQKPTHEEKCLKQEMSDNSSSQVTTNGQENDNSGDGNENVNNSSEGGRNENEFKDAVNNSDGQEMSDNSSSQVTTNGQENDNSGDGNENVNNSSEGGRNENEFKDAVNNSDGKGNVNSYENEFMDGDDNNKENAAAVDENRMHDENWKQNGRKVLAMNDQSGQVRKKVTQAQDRNLKEGLISCSSTVVKLKKPKATNPKPFRLRTDERGILKETKLERRTTDHVAPQTQSATLSSTFLLSGKSQMKKRNDNNIQGLKIPKGPERSKPVAAAVMPESKKHRDGNAMQRLEKFRKISCPLQKHSIRPQEHVSTKKELTPFLIPGQKLDVIPENSPEILEIKRFGKTNVDAAAACAAASRSSLHGRRQPITVATHVPRATFVP